MPQALLDWLGIVFRPWGGFITGLGIVIAGIGVTIFSGRSKWRFAHEFYVRQKCEVTLIGPQRVVVRVGVKTATPSR